MGFIHFGKYCREKFSPRTFSRESKEVLKFYGLALKFAICERKGERFFKVNEKQMEKESCGNGDFLCFQTRRTKKIFPRTETCESNFLPRREANRIEIGICERVFEIRFLLRKPKLKDLDLD